MRCSFLVSAGAILGLAALGADTSSRRQDDSNLPEFPAGAGAHETQADAQNLLASQSAPQIPVQPEVELLQTQVPPTRGSFMASWQRVSGAIGYRLDVSTDPSFDTFVDDYHDLDVGNVMGRVVTGLNSGTTYYYRVRAYDAAGPGSYSEVIEVTTEPTTGLIIHATFDSSITGNPNAAAIEAMINRAISTYESLFTDPITIQIRFRYSTTAPNGTPLPGGIVSRSDWPYYVLPWDTFINAWRADATTSNDFLASASVPDYFLSIHMTPASANGRAVGLNTPPEMFANGTVGTGGPYDGIVTLNSVQPFRFTRPTTSGNFDAQRATEHEIDEVMGFGSHLNISGPDGDDLRPQDLFSWSSAGGRNTTSSGTRYFSVNSGSTNIINFNQNPNGDFGDWLSASCPQAHPYVQNAFFCTGPSSDIAATSPEGINLDVIGYDLVGASGFVIPDTTSRGMVFDFAGQNLYISTSTGLIKTFNLSTRSLVRTYNLGGSLNGIDIARDNSFILAAQNNFGTSQGKFQRVHLATGTITDINYPRESTEGGGWDVAISSNGLALVTTQGDGGSSWTPLRQIDLNTNAITVRTDAPGSGFNHQLATSTLIHRSADGTRLSFMEGDDDRGPVFTYSALTNTFGPSFRISSRLDFASGAVNRNGNLIGLHTYGTPASLRTAPDFSFVHSFNEIDSGVAFDAVHDIFYGINSTTDQIIAYSTATYAELFRLTIGENVGSNAYEFGAGTLVASANGHWIAVETYSGVRVFQLPSPPPATNPATNVASSSATLNGSFNPRGLSTTVYFQYGTTTGYGHTTTGQSYNGNTAQSVSANISGLNASTTYHFRIVAQNDDGTSYGSDRTFTTLTLTGAPVVVTNLATNIASYSATLNGSVDPHGLTTTVYFQYGTTTSYGLTTTPHTKTGNTYQAVSANISGLTASTAWHFRMVATNSAGTTYGSDRTFTTLSATGPPVVITNPATLIASFSARLNSSVDPHGLSTAVYFQYGATTSYGLATSPQSKAGNAYQNVAAGISSLIASTTYHFRIVATNSAGTTYGTDQTFTTLSATGPPVVTTNAATNLTSSSATLNGSLDPHGLTTSVHFQYGTTTSYGHTTASQSHSGNTYLNISANISSLTTHTTYHFRMAATNSAGTRYGSDRTFTTP
ncbi:MAG TPA: NF038122 family metalloprotease [Candidatus Udaeobacter sp.]|nr:NF038122 family metalloprotease [Candidatus Udaeobacter sp.]